MTVDLSQVVNNEGARVRFSGEADLSGCDALNFIEPVRVSGTVSNLGGDIEIAVSAQGLARLVCDRCLDEFEKSISVEFSERLVKEDAYANVNKDGSDDAIVFSGNVIDIDEILIENFIASLPIKTLCREDCKGLCGSCGKNLNEGDCGCEEPADPRFDALDNLNL